MDGWIDRRIVQYYDRPARGRSARRDPGALRFPEIKVPEIRCQTCWAWFRCMEGGNETI